jgi:hypothetical protein
MTSETKGPDSQNDQGNVTAPDTAERKRISRLANDLAKRAKERQLRYDHGHKLFTK